MTTPGGLFSASERALEFGAKYAEVLAHWSALFAAASELAAANVALGRMTADASKEFDALLRQTANAPWNWFNPEMMQRFTDAFRPREDAG
ncbi:MAG: hypothetical protein WEC33_06810 [Dehalococcoidia bacterium]